VVALVALAVAFGWGMATLYSSDRYDTDAIAAAPTPDTASMDLQTIVPPASAEGGSLAALAEAGDAKAQFQLGMAYREGETVQRDLAVAYKWLKLSAQQGYADAQFVLGAMHLAGQGVLQSFPAAFEWFERAAQQNHAEAQYSLGRMYRRGYGVAASHPKAYMWFNLAAAQGHERAREARDSLLPLMTPDQIKAAQQESQAWRPAMAKQ